MKKLIVLVLVLSLTLILANGVMALPGFPGMIGYSVNDLEKTSLINNEMGFGLVPKFEGWYTVEKTAPYAAARGTFNFIKIYDFEIYQDDQTFAELIYVDGSFFEGAITYFNGSYLFENNFFIGLDYLSLEDQSQFILSPGYRFDLGKNGYVSLGLDYAVNSDLDLDNGILDYQLKARYYGDKFKVYGQLVLPDGNSGDMDYYLRVGGAYQVMENVTLGARYITFDDEFKTYEIGCSASFDKLGADLSYMLYENEDGDDQYEIHGNLVYSFVDNLRAGAEIVKFEGLSDAVLIFKGQYSLKDKKTLTLMHQVAVDHAMSSVTYLSLDYKF